MRFIARFGWVLRGAVLAVALVVAPIAAQARIEINVDRDAQELEVWIDGRHAYTWPISTGREGYETPAGVYHPSWLDEDHYSKEYDDAPMPHSIFFTGGYAIHGTYSRGLGRAASHGCIRLSPRHAQELFALVQSRSFGSTIIRIE